MQSRTIKLEFSRMRPYLLPSLRHENGILEIFLRFRIHRKYRVQFKSEEESNPRPEDHVLNDLTVSVFRAIH
jgi:hypothetical protein